MLQSGSTVDNSDYQPSSDFHYEEDTWVPPRRTHKADPFLVMFYMFATMEERLNNLISQFQYHVAERDRIQEIAARLDDANRQLEELVVTDHLTGIGNRRLFADRLSLKLAEAERGGQLTVFLIDVDDFKSFNDKFGHQAGDDALREVATALSDVVRRVDCIARYGGEEFALASSVGAEGAVVLADKLIKAVRAIECEHRIWKATL
jgi:diguanylate cyclase (GGDEF)-like protein